MALAARAAAAATTRRAVRPTTTSHHGAASAEGRARRRCGRARTTTASTSSRSRGSSARSVSSESPAASSSEHRRRLHPEHVDACPAGLRPRDRGRLRPGRRAGRGGQRFPKTHFAIVDVDQASLKGKPANVEGLLFREEQVGYLVGYLGALEAKRAGSESISAVGGFKQPPVDRFIVGLPGGRREAAVPRTKVKWGYSSGLGRPGEVQGARAQPDRGRLQGRLPGRGRLRARRVARRQAAAGVGHRVDGDQSFLGPHVLTSALKGVDSAVFLTIKQSRTERSRAAGTRCSASTRTASASASSVRRRTRRTSGDAEGREADRGRRDLGHPDDARLSRTWRGGARAPPAHTPVAQAARTE